MHQSGIYTACVVLHPLSAGLAWLAAHIIPKNKKKKLFKNILFIINYNCDYNINKITKLIYLFKTKITNGIIFYHYQKEFKKQK